jgi:hypothetical protein
VGTSSVVCGECSWRASDQDVEEDAERQREQASHDSLCQSGDRLGEVALEAHHRLGERPAGEIAKACIRLAIESLFTNQTSISSTALWSSRP